MCISERKASWPSNRPKPELLLKLYEKHSSKEIADMYGVTSATVRSWVYRLRKKGESVNG